MPSLIPPDHLRIIRARVPGVAASEIEVNDAGHDHRVYFIQRQLTFRFPRVPRRINPARKRFLDDFAPTSPIPAPLGAIAHDDALGSDYEVNAYLAGVPFEPEVAWALSEAGRTAIAGQLGAWLGALHSFPLDAARALGMDEMDPATFGAYMAENPAAYPYYRRMIFPLLTLDEQTWVERLFGGYIEEVTAQPFAVRATHADMWPYHILVDPQTARVSGVLDYWPRIADPASDFKAFESYGPNFARMVYAAYTQPHDVAFERRRLFYSGRDAVAELARALEGGDPREIAARHAALSAYIAGHPASPRRDG